MLSFIAPLAFSHITNIPFPLDSAFVLLHYISPALVFFSFIGTLIQAQNESNKRIRRRFMLSLIALIALTYFLEMGLLIARGIMDSSRWETQDKIVYTIFSGSVFIIQALFFFENPSTILLPYYRSGILAAAADCAIASMTLAHLNRKDSSDRLQFILIVTRLLLFALVSAELGGVQSIGKTQQAMKKQKSISSDCELQQMQREGLQRTDYLTYLKQFRVFLPYIWPSGHIGLQVSLFGAIFCILAERSLNVLIPSQFGQVIGNITTGRFPWRDFAYLILYTWLRSQAGISVIKSLLVRRLTNWSHEQLSLVAFDHIINLSADFHNSKDTGETIRSVEQATALSRLLTLTFVDFGPVFADMAIGIVYLVYLVDIYCAYTMLATCVLYLYATYKLTAWSAPQKAASSEGSRNTYKQLFAAFGNWNIVSCFNRQKYEYNIFKKAINKEITADVSYGNAVYTIQSIQDIISTAGQITVLALGAYRVYEGTRTIGNLVTLNAFWASLSSHLCMLAISYRQFNAVLIDAEKLLEILQTKSQIQDGKNDLILFEENQNQIEFKDIGFSYDARKPTLTDISFTAKPGQTIALVGETGSGKSTILKLLLRFADASSGSIMINDQNIKDITLKSLRQAFGIVPQDPSIFNKSILENIQYACLNATKEEVIEACKEAALHEKILSFPDGYETRTGENGMRLSGGELQRVAIARIILRKPRFILLDEATSAVDSIIEEQIQKAFKKVSAGCINFIVAHRLSTIVDADQILVIDKGRIIEQGTHTQLVRRHGRYNELWKKQTSMGLNLGSLNGNIFDQAYAQRGSMASISIPCSPTSISPPSSENIIYSPAQAPEKDIEASYCAKITSPTRTSRADSLGEAIINSENETTIGNSASKGV